MDTTICDSDEEDRLSWKSLSSDYDTLPMRRSVSIESKAERQENYASQYMKLPSVSSMLNPVPPPAPMRTAPSHREDYLRDSTNSLRHFDHEGFDSLSQSFVDEEWEIPSVSALVYDQTLSCLKGVSLSSVNPPRPDPVIDELSTKLAETEMKLRTMSERMLQVSADAKSTQLKNTTTIARLEGVIVRKDEELQEGRNKHQSALKRIESADAKIIALEDRLHRQEQQHILDAENVSKQLNEVEMLRNRLLDSENMCEKLKQQLHDASVDSERNRREYMKNINERDQKIKQLQFTTNREPSPAPDTLITIEQERQNFRSMIDEFSKKIEHCSPKPQEDFIRLKLEIENLRREKHDLADQLDMLKSSTVAPHYETPAKEPKKFLNNLHITPITRDDKTDDALVEETLAKPARSMPVSLSDLGFRPPTSVGNHPTRKGANDSVRQLLAFDSPAAEVVPLRRPKRQPKIANAPFANDTNNGDKDSVKKRDLERQLMHLHVEKEQLEAEYAKLDQGGGGRTIRERKRKCLVEDRMALLNREISALKHQLRTR